MNRDYKERTEEEWLLRHALLTGRTKTRDYKEWTDDELAVLVASGGELTARQIAAMLPGRGTRDVYAASTRYGIPIHRRAHYGRREWTEAELTLVQHCKARGMTSRQVEDILAEAGYLRSAGAIRRIWGQFDGPPVEQD